MPESLVDLLAIFFRALLQLVGLHTDRLKLKTAAISLDGLLDYNTSDK